MKIIKFILLLALVSLFQYCKNDKLENLEMEAPITVTEYVAVDVQKTKSTPIFAHYMPWFESPQYAEYPNTQFGNWGIHWTMNNKNPENINTNGEREIASHFYPLIGPYDNGEDNYLEYAVVCMKLTGLDGIFIDYAGVTEVYDWSLLHNHTLAIIPWLKKAGLKFSLVYEDSSLKNAYNQTIISDKVTEGKRVLNYINNNLFSKANYFRFNDKPVLLNFGPQAIFTDTEWNSIFSNIQEINFFTLPYTKNNYNLTNAASGEFAWVGETVDNTFYQHMEQYQITIGGAMPEFKDFYQEGGWGNGYPNYSNLNEQLLTQTLQRSENTDIIQIITWNDFGEGTIIEPTKEFGYSRLEQIQEFLGVSYREQELSLAINLYSKRKKYQYDELINKKLDQVFYYLISLQIDNAQELLNSI
jgi:hypothetical protein|tara:strand:+ start:215 stop:1459 length:1245 start_codon:yes stop_codon:yes gene_type:complete